MNNGESLGEKGIKIWARIGFWYWINQKDKAVFRYFSSVPPIKYQRFRQVNLEKKKSVNVAIFIERICPFYREKMPTLAVSSPKAMGN